MESTIKVEAKSDATPGVYSMSVRLEYLTKLLETLEPSSHPVYLFG